CLDIFVPDAPNGKAMFYIHGGGWYDGDKTGFHPTARYMCERGYVCASINYRLTANGDIFPKQIEDTRHAMAFFRARAKEYGFDRHRVAASGSSAGGHLAALLATIAPEDDLGASDELRDRDTRPNAVVAYSTLFTVMPLPDAPAVPDDFDYIGLAMGGTFEEVPEVYRRMSPIERLDKDTPPFLVIHGKNDETIPVGRALVFKRYMDAAKRPATLEIMDDASHGFCYGMHSPAQRHAAERAFAYLETVL
ncbi:MAG: alpha/beta hydrolase, partial [Kiritimatiellaeota bacterium]|nr:alpha/beta hydrolase [Kiritimatiellota bacterium]